MSAIHFGTEPTDTQNDHVASHAFWPEISLSECRQTMRIDDSVTGSRLLNAIVQGITETNRQLTPYRQAQSTQGIACLADVPSDEHINGESILVWNYRQAVYQYAKARLLEIYADFAASKQGENLAQAKLEQADTYKREGHAAIAYILNRHRVDCELL